MARSDRYTSLESEMRHEGYSKEEEYFYELNRDLIEKRRQNLDRERAAKHAEKERSLHWMKCPKCGQDLKDQELLGIRYERCSSCLGVFFDDAELETLFKMEDQKKFLSALWTKLRSRLGFPDTNWRP